MTCHCVVVRHRSLNWALRPKGFFGRPGFHYPIGLDLRGDTLASVALAIVGEITAYFNERSGGKNQ